MWVVAIDKAYYPSVTSYSDYEMALKEYEWECEYHKNDSLVSVYLTEVLKSN